MHNDFIDLSEEIIQYKIDLNYNKTASLQIENCVLSPYDKYNASDYEGIIKFIKSKF